MLVDRGQLPTRHLSNGTLGIIAENPFFGIAPDAIQRGPQVVRSCVDLSIHSLVIEVVMLGLLIYFFGSYAALPAGMRRRQLNGGPRLTCFLHSLQQPLP